MGFSDDTCGVVVEEVAEECTKVNQDDAAIVAAGVGKANVREVRLLRGERLGWWSQDRYDNRVRPRALVHGAVNDRDARILLDSGANISMLSLKFAEKLRLDNTEQIRAQLSVQGLSEQKLTTTLKAGIKITLGWAVVYIYEVWIGDHHGGCDLILGTDFLMCAGICLDMYRGRANLPDEVVIPLSGRTNSDRVYMERRQPITPGRPLIVFDRQIIEIRIPTPRNITVPVLWVAAHAGLFPKVVFNGNGVPRFLQLHNITGATKNISPHDDIAFWISEGTLPWKHGYVRLSSQKYKEWQILIDEATSLREFKARRQEEEAEWDRRQPPAVPKPNYPIPTKILVNKEREISSNKVLSSEENLNEWFVTSAIEIIVDANDPDSFKHEGAELYAEDLENEFELSMLPDILGNNKVDPIDVSKIVIGDDSISEQQQERMRRIVQKHIRIFEDSGNAAPPLAKGVLCDIDVGDAKPVFQKARSVRWEYLEKLHKLLKVLLKNKLIRHSTSSWASPIVIVIKKNGEDIRLCIDYRVVNALTKLMVSAMPNIDELLANFEAVMWFCSFDACSGFWSVGMTERASEISAFICPLGHFQWLRMAQGLKNAPQLYQRMLDNAIWGFVRPKGGWTCDIDRSKSVDIFQDGEIEDVEKPAVIVRRSYIDDISFGAETWDHCCEMLDQLLRRMIECGISLSLPKSQFGQRRVEFLSHYISFDGIEAKPKDLPKLKDLPFPSSKKAIQSFLGTLNYYNKFIQDFSAHAAILYEFGDEDFGNAGKVQRAAKAFELLKMKMCSTPVLKHFDRQRNAVVIVYANEWAIGATLAQEYDGKLHPIRFTSRVLKQSELNYHLAEKEVLALLRILQNYFYLLRGQKVRVYSRHSTMQWLFTNKALLGRTLQFAVMLSPWDLDIRRCTKGEDSLTGLLTSAIVPPEKMDESLSTIFPDKAVRTVSTIPVVRLKHDYEGFVISADGSAKPPEKGGYGSHSFIVWHLPEWSVKYAESFFEEKVTVNEAEYFGLLRSIEWGISAKSKVHEKIKAFDSIKFVHVPRVFNHAADHLASVALASHDGQVVTDMQMLATLASLNCLPEMLYEADSNSSSTAIETLKTQSGVMVSSKYSESSTVERLENNEQSRITSAVNTNEELTPIKAQEERFRRISAAQDEERRWKNLKHYLKGELSALSIEEAQHCQEEADAFEVSSDGILYYLGANHRHSRFRESDEVNLERLLRLVVPTTLIEDMIRSAHDEVQGGHQGMSRTWHRLQREYFWSNMFADIQQHIAECSDCSTAKGKPRLKGKSPGNILPNRPFQIISMDFVTPLPRSYRGNSSLLLFQCMFSGYVMSKPMAGIESTDVAKAFMECVFQRFGACEILRHDMDPKFVSKVFEAFNRMLRQRQRSTLAYRPQANGQQERSVKTVSQTVKTYICDSEQRDWDEWSDMLMFALNTSFDFTRQETPFYIVHGWDARNTISAMIPSIMARGSALNTPAQWRRDVKRRHEYAMKHAWEMQKKLKEIRARRHNEVLNEPEEPFAPGDAVWLYMNNVRPGLAKKLAHLWHGSFRVKSVVNSYSVELELPDKEGYRFYPTIHVSRLKLRRKFPARPEGEIVCSPGERFDFDEALLPEDSWIDEEQGKYEVESLLDVRWKRLSRRGRREKEYLAKWVGYEDPTWTSEHNLSCGALIFEFEEARKRDERLRMMQISDEGEEGR